MTRYICFSTVGGHERPISASESAKIDAMHCQIRTANKVSKPVPGDDSFQGNRLPCTREERRPNNVVILAPRERFVSPSKRIVYDRLFPFVSPQDTKKIIFENRSSFHTPLKIRSNTFFFIKIQPEEKSYNNYENELRKLILATIQTRNLDVASSQLPFINGIYDSLIYIDININQERRNFRNSIVSLIFTRLLIERRWGLNDNRLVVVFGPGQFIRERPE